MKSLNEAWALSSRQIDRSFELNKDDAPSRKAEPRNDLAPRVARQPRPAPGKDGAKIIGALKDIESTLNDIYDFDSSKYNEQESAEKLSHLETALQLKGVPQHVIDAGLRQPKTDIGRRGVRHMFHWNAQKPVHSRRIQRSFARMKALVAPVAAAQSRLKSVQGVKTAAQRDLAKAEKDLAGLKERRDNLVGHHKAMGVGKATAKELKQVKEEIAELELDIAADRLVVADADNETAELTSLIDSFGGDDSAATSHFGRVQGGLDTIGGNPSFQKTYDKLNPGARKSRFWGYLGKKLAHPIKSIGKKLVALVTLGVSSIALSWRGAVKAQDKARRFVAAGHQLPTPAAKMMAAVLLDRFDAEAYKKGLGAAMATAHLPLALHVPGAFNIASGPISSAIGGSMSAGVHGELARELAKDGIGDIYGDIKEQLVGSAQNQAVRMGSSHRQDGPFPMPTVPITMGSGDDAKVKHVDLTDKKTCLAVLVHLGPAVDQQKIRDGDQDEISRRNLRREIFHAGDNEDFGPSARSRTPAEKAFDKQLKKALFDPEHENRDQILQRASPMRKMFAAAGML